MSDKPHRDAIAKLLVDNDVFSARHNEHFPQGTEVSLWFKARRQAFTEALAAIDLVDFCLEKIAEKK